MERRSARVVGVAAVVVLIAAGATAVPLFLPEKATRADESLVGDDPSAAGAQILATGTFVGTDGHQVSGSIRLASDAAGAFLEFVDYQQTQGPDVYVYLTPSATPDTRSEIDAGARILIDGGADGGESTKVGNFRQDVPKGLPLDTYGGVGIWCDRFSTPFGYAPLAASVT